MTPVQYNQLEVGKQYYIDAAKICVAKYLGTFDQVIMFKPLTDYHNFIPVMTVNGLCILFSAAPFEKPEELNFIPVENVLYFSQN